MPLYHLIFLILTLMIPENSGLFQMPDASDDIIFYQDFESENMFAALSSGNPAPIVKFGKIKFGKGLRGNALFCGKNGAKIRYLLDNNMDFSNQGSVVFWFCPLEWKNSSGQPRVLFFGTEDSRGFIGVQTEGPLNGAPLERELKIMLLYFKAISDAALSVKGPGQTGDNQWHMIAFAWDKDKIYLSLDGQPYSIKKLSAPLDNKLFPGKTFSIGSNGQYNYLMDEFIVYRRILTEIEISKIYNTTKRN